MTIDRIVELQHKLSALGELAVKSGGERAATECMHAVALFEIAHQLAIINERGITSLTGCPKCHHEMLCTRCSGGGLRG